MSSAQTLKQGLERRFEKLREAEIDTFDEAVKAFFLFADNKDPVKTIQTDLTSQHTAAIDDVERFLANPIVMLAPSTEAQSAAFGHAALRKLTVAGVSPRQVFDATFYRKGVVRDETPVAQQERRALKSFKDRFLTPFELYVIDQLDATEVSAETEELDDLLPILRRRSYDKDVQVAVRAAKADTLPLSLLFIDIDFFKNFNDENSHSVGDEVLRGVAEITKRISAGRGRAYRIGGEEMAVLLPNHSWEEAQYLAERIRTGVASSQFSSRSLSVSVSLGVAEIPSHASEAKDLYDAADQAMYAAKLGGRNCVRVSGTQPESVPVPEESVTAIIPSSPNAMFIAQLHQKELHKRDRATWRSNEACVDDCRKSARETFRRLKELLDSEADKMYDLGVSWLFLNDKAAPSFQVTYQSKQSLFMGWTTQHSNTIDGAHLVTSVETSTESSDDRRTLERYSPDINKDGMVVWSPENHPNEKLDASEMAIRFHKRFVNQLARYLGQDPID